MIYVDPQGGVLSRPRLRTFSSNVDIANYSTSNVNASSTFNTAQELPILNITTLLTLNADAGPTSAYIHAYLRSPCPDGPIPPTPYNQTSTPSPSLMLTN